MRKQFSEDVHLESTISSKRKATSSVQGATKAGRAAKVSTPGIATPRYIGDDDSREPSEVPDELNKVIARKVQNFDISSFPYTLPPSVIDRVSRYFQPEQERDFTALSLKADHHNRPLWVNGCGKLIFESFHPLAPRLQDFLITIAEPMSRPAFLHEYRLMTQSLYAAVSVGVNTKDIMKTLDRFLKNRMPPNVIKYITHCGKTYGKVKIVLRNNKYFVETADPVVLRMLLKNPVIGQCRVQGDEEITTSAPTMAGLAIPGTKDAAGVREAEGLDESRSSRKKQDKTRRQRRYMLH